MKAIMKTYQIEGNELDSIELKCLMVSKGVKVGKDVYKKYSPVSRLDISPLTCNCMILSDGTIVQLTDMQFHLQYLMGVLSWSNLKLLRYASELGTPFTIQIIDGKPALFYKKEFLDFVTFPEKTDFYKQKTPGGLPFIGNAVIQGLDWVAFQCMWPCEFAAAGEPCEFCFSGAAFEVMARKGKPLPKALSSQDFVSIVDYAVKNVNTYNIQITGGSTFQGETEKKHILSYLRAMNESKNRNMIEDVLLYITPPEDPSTADEYFSLGGTRIACSLEVWNEKLAETITPGKIKYTTRKRHMKIMEDIVDRHGPGSAFSNFIIGVEPFESLREGATALAERGIIPTASVWMPMGRPVMGSMETPWIDFYRRVKDLYAELYLKYSLEPSGCCGLNVCIERDIFKYSQSLM